MSSVVRTVTGIAMMASATAPAMRREVPHAHHQELVDEQADDDRRCADSSTSLTKRITALRRVVRPYSAR